ncbi:MAG: hypothetical protein R3C24_04960 [Cyanobacteriota/Melainabacteria group bacterium]
MRTDTIMEFCLDGAEFFDYPVVNEMCSIYFICAAIAFVSFWLARFVPNQIKNLIGFPLAASPLLVEMYLPVNTNVVAAFCFVAPIGLGLMARRFWRLNLERRRLRLSNNF